MVCFRRVCTALLIAGFAPQLLGQFGPPQRSGEDLILLAPRAMTRLLTEGERAIADGRYADGISALYTLLVDDSPELAADLRGQDFFVAHGANAFYDSTIKAEANRQLSLLPDAGRQSLELQFGVTARQQLEAAIAATDLRGIGYVVRNFAHTDAGYDAQVLLAQHFAIRGNLLAAAATYERLLSYPHARNRFGVGLARAAAIAWFQAGRGERAQQSLIDAAQHFPGASLELDGRQLNLAETFDWGNILESSREIRTPEVHMQTTDNWVTAGGNVHRSGIAKAGMPLSTARWVKDIHSSILEREALTELSDMQLQGGNILMPKFELRVVDNLVITKTTDSSILAIDFESGNIRWPFYQLGIPYVFSERPFSASFDRTANGLSPEIQSRVWGSSAFGQLSCDLERLYAVIDDIKTSGGNSRSPHLSNLLVGLSIPEQGSMSWQVGGADGGNEPRLKDAYFLGPPLAVAGELFCLVEINTQMQLVVLEAASGKWLWSQQLVNSIFPPISMDELRRSQALAPTMADGVILCPTGLGAVVAVDLLTRSLRWAAVYGTGDSPRQSGLAQPSSFMGLRNYSPLEQRWQDPAIIAQDGYMVLTPPEADKIVARDILSGSPCLPELSRNHARYVAGIHDGRVVLVGENRLAWFKIPGGNVTTGPGFPDAKTLAGRGIWEGDTLLLPLSGQTMGRFSTRTGELLEQTQVDQPLGNLFAYKNQLLSVSATAVAAYYTRESLLELIPERRLEDADSVWALNQESQLELAGGRIQQAVELLTRAFELEPDNADTRYLLVETLLKGLESDFETYRATAQKFDSIMEYGPQRFRFLQRLALGNIHAGEHVAAFTRLLELMHDRIGPTFSPSQTQTVQLRVEEGYTVDSDTWIATNLARVYNAADDDDRLRIRLLLARELRGIENQVLSFRRLKLRYFGWLAAAERANLSLASTMFSQDEQTAGEQVLLPLLLSMESETRAAAMSAISQRSTGDHQWLSQHGNVERLRSRGIIEGLAGMELTEFLAANYPEPIPWNSGMLDVSLTNERDYQQGTIVDQQSQRFGRPEFRVAMISEKLVLYNGNGQSVARLNYDRATGDTSDRFVHATVRGGLLVVETLSEVAAFDIYRGLSYGGDAMLWRHSLINPGASPSVKYEPTESAHDATQLGFSKGRRQMPGNQPAVVGPLTASGIVVQTGAKIMLLDSLTGKKLWIRDGFSDQVEFTMDGIELTVIRRRGETMELQVLDCRDGASIRSESYPGRWTNWYSYQGYSVDFAERFDASGSGFEIPMTLRIWNPATGQVMFERELKAGSRAGQCGRRYLVIAEPEVSLHFLDLNDPAQVIHREFEVPLDSSLDTISLQQFGDQLVVLSNASGRGKTARDPLLFRRGDDQSNLVPVNGMVTAIDLTDLELSWDSPGRLLNMQFPTIQPRSSPFMVTYRVNPNTRTASMALIDLRDGSISFALRSLPMQTDVGFFAMQLRPLEQAISIDLGVRSFEFIVTDGPRPPQPVFDFRSR